MSDKEQCLLIVKLPCCALEFAN